MEPARNPGRRTRRARASVVALSGAVARWYPDPSARSWSEDARIATECSAVDRVEDRVVFWYPRLAGGALRQRSAAARGC